MNLILQRQKDDGIRTLGVLAAGEMKFATVERPWIENTTGPGGMPRQSCIPKGRYKIEPWDSAQFPRTYILTNPNLGVYRQPGDIPKGQTWGRSAILIHVGNMVDDVVGCIAVGLDAAPQGVARSAKAMIALNRMLGRSGSHQLDIL